jgi:hypothetical protein
MSKIDDPIDASFEAFLEEPEGMGRKFTDLALSFTGLVFPSCGWRSKNSGRRTILRRTSDAFDQHPSVFHYWDIWRSPLLRIEEEDCGDELVQLCGLFLRGCVPC